MAGQLAIRAPHLDGSEPVATWVAAAWAVYVDLMSSGVDTDALDSAWEALTEPVGAEAEAPTMETWGTSDEAQAAQMALMASLSAGGMGPAGEP